MQTETIQKLKEILAPFSQLSELQKKTANESAGPCPVCGGDDRFFVRGDRGYCRQCNLTGGDIIHWHCLKDGLDMAGLCEKYGIENGNGSKPKLVKTYDYTDKNGKLLHQSLRYEPGKNGEKKSFSQRRPDGDKWAWNLKGITTVLYRLPEITKVDEVLIVEGEKDADNLSALGYAATTCPMGAEKWRDHYNDALQGKRVVIIPDNDGPGRKHLAKVALSLSGAGIEARVAYVPEDLKDVSDFLATFTDPTEAAERLAVMIDGAEPWGPGEEPEAEPEKSCLIHISEIIGKLKPVEWRVHGMYEDKTTSYTFGDSSTYKSFKMLDILLCIAAGIDYHGHQVKQDAVVYACGEGQQGIGRRLSAWGAKHKINLKDLPFYMTEYPTQLMEKDILEKLCRDIDRIAKKHGPPAMLGLDTLNRNMGGGDENKTSDMTAVFSNLDQVFKKSIGIDFIHHTGQLNKDRERGSIVLRNSSDVSYKAAFTIEKQVLITNQKPQKDGPPAEPMLFDIEIVQLLIDGQKSSSCVLNLFAEGAEAMAACGLSGKTEKLSKKMRAALDVLDKMSREVENRLAEMGKQGERPLVNYDDWRSRCIDKNIYKRTDYFDTAANSMENRKLVYFESNRRYVYGVYIASKYNNLCHILA